jgi:hypothetical protein
VEDNMERRGVQLIEYHISFRRFLK